jgi:hypothetical protein
MQRLVWTLVLIVAGTGLASAEQYYKWKDADGVWHYTTTPPPKDVQTDKVAVSRGPLPPIEPVATEGQGEPATDEARKVEQVRAQIRQACDRARANVAVLQETVDVEADTDGDGKLEKIEGQSRAKELERARQLEQAYCTESESADAGG